jgi:hypothetical protein
VHADGSGEAEDLGLQLSVRLIRHGHIRAVGRQRRAVGRLADLERDPDRYPVRSQRGLQPGRVLELADPAESMLTPH